ncbi:MAG: hypothetical protein NC309_09135 [Ruminococcus sp.]|nr:hypothetical protein [Clostridium sp.]MCM1209077.1 hypothetical protein [Ruminococcus sp.]
MEIFIYTFMSVFVYIIILCLLIADSETVISGASYGLMLWYKNVVPILLPFMLISSLVVERIASGKSKRSALFSTIFLGVLCGYPIGARVTDEYVTLGMYEKRIGNIILPLCNNSSPMFISGYIVSCILKNKISFFTAMLIIYAPYIFVTLISLLIIKSKTKTISGNIKSNSQNMRKTNDAMLSSIIQITYVGIYIMICSIIMQFILKIDFIPHDLKIYLSSAVELTRGADMVYKYALVPENIKTALLLALTSFGGVSAILQTNKVIANARLSIIRYIFMKVLCAAMSFFLGALII